MKFQRIYHPVSDWEEMRFNMWGDVADRKSAIELAVKFTGDHVLYGEHMLRVVREWPVSCENALTDYLMNRKAWIGHAACALAIGVPEDITRAAWGKLTDEQQFLANKEAERAIQYWENGQRENRKLSQGVGGPMLSRRNT